MITDIFVFFIILFLGISVLSFFKQSLSRIDRKMLIRIWFFHLLVGVYFCFFIDGDAIGYWAFPKTMSTQTFFDYLFDQKGTFFIYSFNYLPSKILGLSYFSGTLIYIFIGYIGLIFFYLITIKIVPRNSKYMGYKLFPLLFFLPNLHFWSVAVGKDTLLFFCIAAFCFSMLNLAKRFPLLILSLVLSYLVRPHITLFLFISFGLAYLLDAKTSTFKRVFFMAILLSASIAILPIVMKYAKVEDTSIESVNKKFADQAVSLNKGSGSGVDISSYPLPLKIFTFLYRPLFFDANGFPALIASFENLLLLILSYKVFKYRIKETFLAAPFIVKGLVFFLFIGAFAFGSSLGNLGIMIRMRNMFLPGLLIYILWAFSYKTQQLLEAKRIPS